MNETILKVEGLKKYFPIKGGVFQTTIGNVKAVDGVSFEIKKGETLGLVGESGCGKSTTGRTILRLLEKTEGSVIYKGTDIHELKKKELRNLRTDMQIVFQDPYSSLNPRMSIGEIISEAVIHHGIVSKKDARDLTLETMRICGLSDYQIDRYPHEFSGGQRQRIGIARALILNPSFIVADEPVSALDVSIQAQIINLLSDLQEKRDLTYLFISHDLSVVEHLSTKVGVMYLGSMVELADKAEIYKNPIHPYTKALFSAIPIPDPTRRRDRIILTGDIPSPSNPPTGCKFHTRCPYATARCSEEEPQYKNVGSNHFVACHLV
ncbi:dipeptide ABC transporter ATP-binding protein [Clostridium sp. NSJ-6]|uniref:Dipeptide ABC transporter ATP-binding protein n=1 Tax=Clostridium hominis TaxID=2763036 RepID=A0ABR7DER0_9CLOT|nr:dipeptide ABC transporter ATP-binding protein [Clostridium hominis]MBC5629904.1 dipeptide ABC transporter ATP-binding protein [Clostridium hominis]MDU2673849.1 dipeptide ABC transporter ATP-binding protein [Clostridium sp.]